MSCPCKEQGGIPPKGPRILLELTQTHLVHVEQLLKCLFEVCSDREVAVRPADKGGADVDGAVAADHEPWRPRPIHARQVRLDEPGRAPSSGRVCVRLDEPSRALPCCHVCLRLDEPGRPQPTASVDILTNPQRIPPSGRVCLHLTHRFKLHLSAMQAATQPVLKAAGV
jgi:hypothetical protein